MSLLKEVKDDMRGWRLGRVITIVDRGFSSEENLTYLNRAGGHWIAGERMCDGAPDVAEALSRQGRYQIVCDNLRVKDIKVGDGDSAKRFVVCHNPAEAERQQTIRENTITRLEAELERIDAQRTKAGIANPEKSDVDERRSGRNYIPSRSVRPAPTPTLGTRPRGGPPQFPPPPSERSAPSRRGALQGCNPGSPPLPWPLS
jgi:hypothetical protein